MPEHRSTSRGRRQRRPARFAVLVAATLLVGPMTHAAPVAAADPDLSGPVPSPLRGGGWKDEGSGMPGDAHTTGRLIVRYREGTTAEERARVRGATGMARVSDVALPNAELLAPVSASLNQAIARLDANDAVAVVEPEYRREPQGGPTGEPLFGSQWSLHNTGQTVEGFAGVPNIDMNVPEAWDITTGSASVIVAVIDDGVAFSHPDLAGRAWVNDDAPGDGIDNDGNGFVDDTNGYDFCDDDGTIHEGAAHGTHIAGSIAANGNGAGIAGVAPNVRVMAVRFISGDPSCGTDSQAIAAIQYAAANGAHIINASWGGTGASTALGDAIEAVPNVLVVAAAGNDGADNDVTPFYPASYDLPNVLSVASIHNWGYLSEFSNFGALSVDLSAPGEDVISSTVGGGWAFGDGTSMAAANASGVAALVASARPEVLSSGAALHNHLIATAKALPSTLGWVRIPRLLDARAAVVSRPDIVRLAGLDRYSTAAAISASTFTAFVPHVFIATGQNFPDALAGGALAAQLGAPLLLVRGGDIPSATVAELQRLAPAEIYILGGSGVVSEAVATQLRQYSTTDSVFRIFGPNRYATAAKIAEAGFLPGVPNVFIATGLNFPDALAGVPASAALGGPLLLVRPTSIPPETAAALDSLDPQRIVILGGSGVVSDGVLVALDAYTTGPVERVAGANRYDTAVAVATFAFGQAETAYVANGLNFPDALAGGPAAGAYLGPLLLTPPDLVPFFTGKRLEQLQPSRIFILGGTGVVSNAVVDQINALFP